MAAIVVPPPGRIKLRAGTRGVLGNDDDGDEEVMWQETRRLEALAGGRSAATHPHAR